MMVRTLSIGVRRRKRRGIALVLVLMVIAIMTILVLELHFNTRVNARISSNVVDELKAYYLAKSGVHVAARVLVEDGDDNKDDHLLEEWALPLPPIPVGEGLVQVKISDESSKLDLNRLVRRSGSPDTRLVGQFEQLLHILALDPLLVNNFIDWIDADNNHYVNGTYEDAAYGYNSTEVPYACKNAYLDTIAEAALISGITPEIYKILSPLISINSGRKININTADVNMIKAIILSIDQSADENIANQIVEYRQENHFTRSSMRRVLQNELGIPNSLASRMRRYMGTNSTTFEVVSNATVNGVQKSVTAIVKRSKGKYSFLYWRLD